MLKNNVLLKEIPRALVFKSNFVFQKLVRRDNLKIFLGVSQGFFVVFFVVIFRFFFFFVFFFLFFFFSFSLKFLVGMSSSFRVFIHVFGVNQCGV